MYTSVPSRVHTAEAVPPILNVDISDADMAARRAKWVAPSPRYERGWGQMYTQHIEQADKGCDFDFLRTDFGAPVPEPEIN